MNRRKFGQLFAALTVEQTLYRAGAQSTAPSLPTTRFSCEIAMLKLPSFERCIEVVPRRATRAWN